MSSSNSVVGTLGFIGGVAFTLITKLGEGWIKEYFEKRKQKQLEKKQAAKDINSFCTEGMHKGFRIRARSEQHIKFRATEIEAIDISAGTKLRQFIDEWSKHRNITKRDTFTPKDEKMAKEHRDCAQQLGEELLVLARKWGK